LEFVHVANVIDEEKVKQLPSPTSGPELAVVPSHASVNPVNRILSEDCRCDSSDAIEAEQKTNARSDARKVARRVAYHGGKHPEIEKRQGFTIVIEM
jgi:hypothetical protein